MGNPYISANSRIVFAKEASFGVRPESLGGSIGQTGDGALQAWGYTTEDIEFPDKVLDVRKYPTFGSGRQYRRLQGGPIDRPASLTLVPVNGLSLYYAFGSETFAAGSPNVHTLFTGTPGVVADAEQRVKAILPSFSWGATMFDDANARSFQRIFVGDVIDQATFSCSTEEELRFKYAVKAQDVEDEQLGSPTVFANTLPGSATATAGRPYLWFDSIVTVYGTQVARATSFETGINHKLRTMRYLVAGSGQKPFEYLTSLPEFTFKMDFVPAGFLSSHLDASSRRESLYDLLEGETFGDVTIELRKAADANDSIKFSFYDCLFKEAPHPWKADGNEVTVGAIVEPRNFDATVRDALAAYATL